MAEYETIDQIKLMNIVADYPLISDFLFAIPNGGLRHPAIAKKLKDMGAKAGVSDLFLPIPINGHYGLWIELKASPRPGVMFKPGKPTKLQLDWLEKMQMVGYQTSVCYGTQIAWACICNYVWGQDKPRKEFKHYKNYKDWLLASKIS